MRNRERFVLNQKEYCIAPSILAADFARLGAECDAVLSAGADMIHFDVMDNHFVPNLTMGPMVCKALREYGVSVPIDVHLMVEPVDELIVSFAKAGATYITFHPEASKHVDRSLQLIKDLGCKAGLVLSPAVPVSVCEQVLERLDILLLMSVNPGFGGQAFISYVLNKIKQARQLIDSAGCDIQLEVDGGIKEGNIAKIAAAGADVFVVGSAIFGAADYAQSIASLRSVLSEVAK